MFERMYFEIHRETMQKRNEDKMTKLYQKIPKDQRNPPFIEEPYPGENHLFCAICREAFTVYLDHVFSSAHREKVRAP